MSCKNDLLTQRIDISFAFCIIFHCVFPVQFGVFFTFFCQFKQIELFSGLAYWLISC